jgi:curved DNA-binding protein CbpA
MTNGDYYKALGVEKDAPARQIREAYRKLAYQYHPDRNPGNADAGEMMKRLNEAYAVLSNPEKRQEYDSLRNRYGDAAYNRFRQSYTDQEVFRNPDIHRVFEEMARSFGFRGVDEVFRDFYGPGYRGFSFTRPGFFAKGFVFTGTGPIKSPYDLKLPHAGPLGKLARLVLNNLGGGAASEKGGDVNDTIRIDPQLALTGGPYAYFLREKSKKLVVKIPAGVRNGQRIRLTGMGHTAHDGGQSGDLYLKVHIRRPILDTVKEKISRLVSPAGRPK